MFDFLKRNKTTSLEEHYKEQGYLKEKLNLAENNGKAQAKAEAKEEAKDKKKQKKKVSMLESFQDYATEFAKQPSVMGELKIGGLDGRKKKNTIPRSRFGL